MKTITVFTPAYNRAHTLRRAFNSLKAQTCKDFEWLIIDDGSTDRTSELVERLQKEADFAYKVLLERKRWETYSCQLFISVFLQTK